MEDVAVSIVPWELFEFEMVEGEIHLPEKVEVPNRKECVVCGAIFSTY